MKAVGLTAILKDLKVLEVIKAGSKAIELNQDLSTEVYEYYLNKMLNDLKFCMGQLQDIEVINPYNDRNF